ncbi:MAG: hypothetical protein AAF378_01340, partial [Cyanobacteria bacterium P01_A01_bin.84]
MNKKNILFFLFININFNKVGGTYLQPPNSSEFRCISNSDGLLYLFLGLLKLHLYLKIINKTIVRYNFTEPKDVSRSNYIFSMPFEYG